MKTKILYLLFVIFFTNLTASAQLVAGDTAVGMVISNPNINLSVSVVNQTKYALLDLDCDSVADMRIELYKGPTMTDGANSASLFVLNSSYEICADTGALYPINYYNLGDTLICSGSKEWKSNTVYELGNYGCMDCSGPFSKNDAFISYRNTSTLVYGWIKLSFDLVDGGDINLPITLYITEVLSPCISTEIPLPPSTSGTYTCGVFSFDAIIIPPSCNGFCDGSIEITNLTGGTPPYNLVWNSVPVQVGLTVFGCSNLSVTITDSTGTTCTFNLYVPDPTPLFFTLDVTNISCYGYFDGSSCVTNLSGGTAPYMFIWNDPSSQLTPCATNLTTGSYTVCVTDLNGCTLCDTATVLEPPQLQVIENVTNASCFGCCDGSIVLTPTGGTGVYNYVFTPSGSPDNLCPDTYNWCVTDVNGCSTCDTVVVSFSTSINTINNKEDVSIIPNPNTGSFSIKSKAFIGNDVYIEVINLTGQLIYNKIINSHEIMIDNMEAGLYFVNIKSKLGELIYSTKMSVIN